MGCTVFQGCQVVSVHPSRDPVSLMLILLFFPGGVSLSSSQQPVVGVFGQDIILPCQLSPPVRLRDMELLWRKYEPEYIIIHSYKDRGKQEVQGRDYKDRTELFPDEFIRGNLSLKLKSLRVKEAGNYQCIVKSAEGNHKALAELQIEGEMQLRALQGLLEQRALHCLNNNPFCTFLCLLCLTELLPTAPVRSFPARLPRSACMRLYVPGPTAQVLQTHLDSCRGCRLGVGVSCRPAGFPG
uniref:Ig-like domain-containing protein n=1 Tax=Apteryx owenii TaxID=8824 RepID=A0A8B9P6Z8_APTOW